MTRVNKCIELLEQGEPIYMETWAELTYEAGLNKSKTWADMILIDLEHLAFDIVGLTQFMRGLKEGGPTASGHPTPTVLISPPPNCTSPEEVIYNAWQVRQILTTGVHGLYYPQARDPESVKAYVSTTRYTFQTIGRDQGLPEGLRGHGGENRAAEIWDISSDDYLMKADPWPLNPEGELLLGLKIEDPEGIANAEAIASTPGIAIMAGGVGDIAMSMGYVPRPDWPYPSDLFNSWMAIEAACVKAGISFVWGWHDPEMTEDQQVKYLIEEKGAKVLVAKNKEYADTGRKITGRKMLV